MDKKKLILRGLIYGGLILSGIGAPAVIGYAVGRKVTINKFNNKLDQLCEHDPSFEDRLLEGLKEVNSEEEL